MLLEIHLFLTLIAFVLLIIGLTNKANKKSKTTKEEVEVRGNIPLLLAAAFMFFFLSYASLDIDYYSCHNQVSWMNGTAENDTHVSNQISCNNDVIKDSPLSSLNLGMGILSSLLSLFFVISIMRESV